MTTLQLISVILIAASVLLCSVRLFLGATTHDRLLAADTIGVITTAGLVWLAHHFANEIYLDISLIYGALSFIGVVAIARVLEGKQA